MRRFCLVMIAVAVLVVAGSSNNGFAATATQGTTVLSPYWQADTNSVYTFIAVTVPSISASFSRSVTVTAVSTGSASDVVASTITVDKGNTARFFIANTNHSSVNSNTVSNLTGRQVQWITVTGQGHITIDVGSGNTFALGETHQLMGSKSNSISVWGAVVVPGGTGFAMEFIGDLSDSNQNSAM